MKPYFALRSYQDAGGHYSGQIGSEETPQAWLEAMWECTREWCRVLKDSGSLFVNLGDKYSGGSSGDRNTGFNIRWGNSPGRLKQERSQTASRAVPGMQPKTLLGLPWRYALGCIDQLGLILRAEIIWQKVNGLPESVSDRVRRSHEQWFHFTLNPRYYSAVDNIREPHLLGANGATFGGKKANSGARIGSGERRYGNNTYDETNPLGKLPPSVWTVPDNGESLVRSVLGAVAANALTIDEGERILWAAQERVSWLTSSSPMDAGNGKDGRTDADTGKRPRSEASARTGHTESPTDYSSDPSRQDSPSTTFAETSPVSTPTTSSQSPEPKTSDAQTRRSLIANERDTVSKTHTLTGHDSHTFASGAAPANSTGSDVSESVWSVPTEPLRVPPKLGIDHFAAYPLEFPLRIIRGWSPTGICTACGEARRPVVERGPSYLSAHPMPHPSSPNGDLRKQRAKGQKHQDWINAHPDSITGEACACTPYTDHPGSGESSGPSYAAAVAAGDYARTNYSTELHHRPKTGPWREYHFDQWTPPPTTPAVILDPFGGTGTTALAAKALGRVGISVDLSHDYTRLARWRTSDPGQLAKAMRVEKPPAQIDGQLGMFEGEIA